MERGGWIWFVDVLDVGVVKSKKLRVWGIVGGGVIIGKEKFGEEVGWWGR